jgi:hypothetical protein
MDEPPNVSILRQAWRLVRNLVIAPKPKKNAIHLVMPRTTNNVNSFTAWATNEFVP